MIGDDDMRRAALLFPAVGALALLPALGAHAAATSCSAELQQVAQTYHLSLSPPATAQAGNSAEQRGSSPSGVASELQKVQGLMSQGKGAAGQGTGEQGTSRTAEAPTTPSRTAEAPATTESRGMAAGPDSLESSGGTLPPATSSGSRDQRGGAAADQLGAADRAKAEGMLSEAQAADAQGKGDQCLQFLRAAQAMLKGRQ
jgi:hypothetical protein